MSQNLTGGESTACHDSPEIFLPSRETYNGADLPITVRAKELCLDCAAFEKCLERVHNGDFNFPTPAPGIIAATTTAERKAMFANGKPRPTRTRIIQGPERAEPTVILMQPDAPGRAEYSELLEGQNR